MRCSREPRARGVELGVGERLVDADDVLFDGAVREHDDEQRDARPEPRERARSARERLVRRGDDDGRWSVSWESRRDVSRSNMRRSA